MTSSHVERNKLHSFLRTRRSIRRFKTDIVPEATLLRVLETATWAPSAHNSQPWRFAVVTNQERKEALAAAMGEVFLHDLQAEGLPEAECQKRLQRSHKRIMAAPCVVMLCLDVDIPQKGERHLELEHWMAVQSVALAGGQLLLAAHAEGLGGVWMCGPLFAQGEVCTSLGLPENWQPQGMILLGYPAGEIETRERLPIENVTVFR